MSTNDVDSDSSSPLCGLLESAQLEIEDLEQFINRIQGKRGTWGFAVYRTVYTPESDKSFPRAIERLTRFIRTGIELSVDVQETPALEYVRVRFINEIMHRFKMTIFENKDEFDGRGADQIASHHTLWMLEHELDPAKTRGVDANFLYIDEECLKDLVTASHPRRRVWSDSSNAALPEVRVVVVNSKAWHSVGSDRVRSTTVRIAWGLWQ